MPSYYLSKLRGTIPRGFWRYGKEIWIQDHLDALIGQGKFSIGHLRLLHFLPLGTSTDLDLFVRTSAVAAAQASLHLHNQSGNLSARCPVSRAFSISSSPRTPFQPSQPGLCSNQTSNCCSRNCFENYRKATMSLSNKEKLNNFLHCGYFTVSLAKTKGNRNSFLGVGFECLHISSRACSSTGTAPEVSMDSMKEELHSSSDPPELNVPIDRTLKLNSASCYLPHPDKEETGGEDAHFICTDEQAIGVADGVGGWADLGIDAGQYARELMSNSANAIREEPRGSIDPARVLEKAYSSTKAKGSSTACIIVLTNQGLHAINLGDSGFMVVRDGCTVFKSPVQQHDFNFTYQLANGDAGDLPSSGQVFKVPVAPGDVIIAGTDGLFDNLYNNEIAAVVVHGMRAGLGPQVTAQKIAALARQRAQDKDRQTPFSTAAQEAGFRYYGGKLDDITVVVSYITCDHNENLSARSSN
ncbi:probable protein phosphatase 2C 55 isoform X2 [Andrographis paniculata]|uniref:probable protein phosphatase 2C 55 isoform X2 n=1 Tax=Andrographis paniculata TaxID=175694 RepID=UPI0021E82A25|nr:probable protein phosphatase 2C 55 isoform X2 [Andrographis paniculata]